MGLKLKGVVSCSGKVAPHYATHPCPTNSTADVDVAVIYSPGGKAFVPELPEGWSSWYREPDGFECPACGIAREKENRR